MTTTAVPDAILHDPAQAEYVYAYEELGPPIEVILAGARGVPVVVWQPDRDPVLYLVAEPGCLADPAPTLHGSLMDALVEAEARTREVAL